jgi:hypothetical protein
LDGARTQSYQIRNSSTFTGVVRHRSLSHFQKSKNLRKIRSQTTHHTTSVNASTGPGVVVSYPKNSLRGKMMKILFSAPRAVLFLILFLTTTVSSWAWQACSSSSSDNDGGAQGGSGTCPTGDTCCATSTPGVSTCISGKAKELGLSGSCCLDNDDNGNNGTAAYIATTGCGVGFQCAKDPASTSSSYRYCQRIDDDDDENPPILPRYRLCSLPDKALKELYGFPVAPFVTNASPAEQEEEDSLLFAYYSNLGPLLDDTSTDSDDRLFAKVKKVIIVIHGSGRNADDYLCCMNAALPPVPGRTHNHADPTNSTILVISPWFLAPEDLPVNITTTSSSSTTAAEPLVWEEDGPIEHTWYGHHVAKA